MELYIRYDLTFEGTKLEVAMMRELLKIMTGLEDEYDRFGDSIVISNSGQKLMYRVGEAPYYKNALLGSLSKEKSRYGGERVVPSLNIAQAPNLFAALFPETVFSYNLFWNNSVECNEVFISAKYSDRKLMIYEGEEERILRLLAERISNGSFFSDEEKEKLLRKYPDAIKVLLLEYDYEEKPIKYNSNDVAREVAAMKGIKGKAYYGLGMELYGMEEKSVVWDDKYVKSFCGDEPLMAAIFRGLMNTEDEGTLIAFFHLLNEKELDACIKIAIDKNAHNAVAYLLDEKHKRSQGEKRNTFIDLRKTNNTSDKNI